MIHLRPVISSDAALLADLHIESWRVAYRGLLRDEYLDGPIEAERRAVWAARLEAPAPDAFGFVAEQHGQPVGFAYLYGRHDPRWGTLLDNLHVRPSLRGGGIGARLLTGSAEETARRYPGEPLYLFVYEGNAPARAFYARMGGREVERQVKEQPGGGVLPDWRVVWDDPAALRPVG